MVALLAASPDYRLLVELVATIEGVELDPTTDETFEVVITVAAGFLAGSTAAILAESLGVRFAD